ncbi:methyl-accepting chemotaxis protein, partial [Arthrospira platensis SPKY1]|nr:methyl-accepting chemotaxis protein [Arthrospira platensis SPKY1]
PISSIQSHLPDFRAEKVVGTNIDSFHKTPSHQRQLLNTLQKPHKAVLKFADNTLELMITPVFNLQNERLATIVEWKDITEQLKTEALMLNIFGEAFTALEQGDFS